MGQSRRWARAFTVITTVVTVSILGWGVASASTTATATVHGASAGGGHDAILGSWQVTATVLDPVPGTAHVLITFTPGGGLVETRLLAKPPIPGVVDFPTMETPGHGGWKRTGPRTYDVKYIYFIQHADGGDLLATETVRWQATVSRDGKTMSGPATSEVHLADGTLVVSWSYSATATKIVP